MSSNLKKIDLINLVSDICKCNYDNEKEYNEAIKKFINNVPNPEAANLIFHHDPELTPEEIVEKALSYKQIILPPSSNKKE